MTTTYLTADYLFDGKRLRKDHAVKVIDGRVTEVVPLASVTRDGQKRHVGRQSVVQGLVCNANK